MRSFQFVRKGLIEGVCMDLALGMCHLAGPCSLARDGRKNACVGLRQGLRGRDLGSTSPYTGVVWPEIITTVGQ
jgi:hypothetical protein